MLVKHFSSDCKFSERNLTFLTREDKSSTVKNMDDLAEESEWREWYRLTPQQRFAESMKLWETYLAWGGSLEPEPDTESPFFDPEEWRENARNGRSGVRVLRRSGI